MPTKVRVVKKPDLTFDKASKFADNPIWTKEDFASAKRITDLPASLQAKLATNNHRNGPEARDIPA